MMTATASQFQRAIDKARSLGGARLVVAVRGDVYTVRGSVAPTVYAVTLGADGELRCACAAGQRELACYHCAAAWLYRLARQVAPRVASDSTVPPSSRAQALGLRRALGSDHDDVSAFDLIAAGRYGWRYARGIPPGFIGGNA